MEKIDITIISAPVKVAFRCPHCEWTQHIDYKTFSEDCGCDPYEWDGYTITCPECNTEYEIDRWEYD